MWRFGGRNSQFTIVDDPLGDFSGQHSVRVLPNGNLLLFDNGLRHNPPESRAVEYKLDTRLMTATMVWEYRHTPPIYAPFVGSVERYTNGSTFIGYGYVSRMTEVKSDGTVAWEGQLMFNDQPGPLFYRAFRTRSLYRLERL